jgi:hypothetical protein
MGVGTKKIFMCAGKCLGGATKSELLATRCVQDCWCNDVGFTDDLLQAYTTSSNLIISSIPSRS